MSPRVSGRWAFAFATLVLTLHELHEIAHTWTGRALCGAWGARDFNRWSLAEGCATWVPTAVGPAFTYSVLWLGVSLLRSSDPGRRHVGLALLFASNPAARILTVALGGGDELVVASRLAGGGGVGVALWLTTLAVVLLICGPALVAAWRALRSARHRWLWFTGLLLGPLAVVIVVVLVGLNGLLATGFLAEPTVWGEPPLVLLSTALWLALLALTARWLVPRRSVRSA